MPEFDFFDQGWALRVLSLRCCQILAIEWCRYGEGGKVTLVDKGYERGYELGANEDLVAEKA